MTSIILLTFLVASCRGVEFSSRPRNFSIELMYFTRLDHFVISPFCIWNVLTCAYLGAGGNTRSAIGRAAILPLNRTQLNKKFSNLTRTVFWPETKGVDIATATFLFHDEDIHIRPLYSATLNTLHGTKISIFNFKDSQTASLANTAVQSLFPTISNVFHADDFTDTSMILSNVIHFSGILSTPFNITYTTEEIIYNEKNKPVGSISMMHLKGKLIYSKFESMKSHILELPYGDDGIFSMLIIFPYPDIKPLDVYTTLDKISLREIFNKLEKDFNDNNRNDEVEVKVPRFRIRGSYNLNKPLTDMGMYDTFEPEFGRFEGISRDRLYVHTIEHRVDIIFTETETVAYATTPGYYDQHNYSFEAKAPQPFLFFLMQKPTASIIFGGIYSKHRYFNELNSIFFPEQ